MHCVTQREAPTRGSGGKHRSTHTPQSFCRLQTVLLHAQEMQWLLECCPHWWPRLVGQQVLKAVVSGGRRAPRTTPPWRLTQGAATCSIRGGPTGGHSLERTRSCTLTSQCLSGRKTLAVVACGTGNTEPVPPSHTVLLAAFTHTAIAHTTTPLLSTKTAPRSLHSFCSSIPHATAVPNMALRGARRLLSLSSRASCALQAQVRAAGV